MIRNFLRSIGVIGAEQKSNKGTTQTPTTTKTPTTPTNNKEKGKGNKLSEILGFKPSDYTYYTLALHHGSQNNTGTANNSPNNERLEYLGDAVLSAVVSHILYDKYRNKREGFLTSMRSKLVQRETLNKLAKEIGLDKLMTIDQNITSAHVNIYGNAFEALIGAIYLDKGFEACYTFMKDVIFAKHINIESMERKEVDYKSELQEWAQKYKHNVEYQLLDETTDSRNNSIFKVKLVIDGKEIGRANGFSKKEAHQMAARYALTYIKCNAKAFSNGGQKAKGSTSTEKKEKTNLQETMAKPNATEQTQAMEQG